MFDHANDNRQDRLAAAADAALRALVGWAPAWRARRSAGGPGSALDDPLLIVVREGGALYQHDIEAAVQLGSRCAIVLVLVSECPAPVGRILVAAPAASVVWFRGLGLWVTPHADDVWLVDRNLGDRLSRPLFRFVPGGLEAHWDYPWIDARDRALGHRQGDLAFTRLLASFLPTTS